MLTLKWGFGAMTLVRIEQSFWCFSNSSFESVPKIQFEFFPFFAFWHWYLHFSNFLACPLIWRVINRVPSGLFRNILGQYEHFVKPCSPWNRFSWEWAACAVLNVLFSQNLLLGWRIFRNRGDFRFEILEFCWKVFSQPILHLKVFFPAWWMIRCNFRACCDVNLLPQISQ